MLREIGEMEVSPKTVLQILTIVVLFGGIVAVALTHRPASLVEQESGADAAAVPTEPEYQLKLRAMNCSIDYGYVTVEGTVTNLTSAPFASLVAVGLFFDGKGDFIKSDQGLVDYQPLLAGQTSPFKVITIGNPAIRRCNVTFKEFWGGPLSVDR